MWSCRNLNPSNVFLKKRLPFTNEITRTKMSELTNSWFSIIHNNKKSEPLITRPGKGLSNISATPIVLFWVVHQHFRFVCYISNMSFIDQRSNPFPPSPLLTPFQLTDGTHSQPPGIVPASTRSDRRWTTSPTGITVMATPWIRWILFKKYHKGYLDDHETITKLDLRILHWRAWWDWTDI